MTIRIGFLRIGNNYFIRLVKDIFEVSMVFVTVLKGSANKFQYVENLTDCDYCK